MADARAARRRRRAEAASYLAATARVPIALAVVWNAVAARRFGNHGWPLAIAKGFAIVVAGFVIDGVMTYVAMQATFRLA